MRRPQARLDRGPRGDLRAWVAPFLPDVEIALEATASSDVIATLLPALLVNVAGSNSRMTRRVAEAALRTDKVGAWVLAR